MNRHRKSDRPIVPKKPSNKVTQGGPGSGSHYVETAERVEGRGLAKGNLSQQPRDRTQSRGPLSNALERIRQAAARDKQQRFTNLWHHVYQMDRLREEYFNLKRSSAPGG